MRILIVQTAFVGDVILASPVIEQLSSTFASAKIDFLLRAGNEGVFENHPKLNEIIVWNKKEYKFFNLLRIIKKIRENKYDILVNLHRFASSGIITFFSAAKQKRGFDSNPFSFCYTLKIKHELGKGKHEVERNLELIRDLTKLHFTRPRLYPASGDFKAVERFKTKSYICIAPASVWFTKQFPKEKWIEYITSVKGKTVYLLGGPEDQQVCESIRAASADKEVVNLSGKLSFLESAALIKDAQMNYVNDSAPLHIASSMNAPVTAMFCSTIPAFGFGPLSDNSRVVETKEKLSCKPCGIHGHSSCPKGHFKCALTISVKDL
jgi:ADP-heptose:LPS heptosyltransferase